ncbi:ATP-binding protein [Desulfofarcimen acetoxidans]|uniref:ATP-binding protein n=1 Tax=Desulfofarcimen acetoxidans TaxID=58138 RepID=UPI001F60BD2C|nr:ATP-binding protein [Desulfofarcimen acetoxidans]
MFKPGFTSKEGHSSLGLSIVKDITAKYGGGVDLSSKDKETIFTVKIPLKR